MSKGNPDREPTDWPLIAIMLAGIAFAAWFGMRWG